MKHLREPLFSGPAFALGCVAFFIIGMIAGAL